MDSSGISLVRTVSLNYPGAQVSFFERAASSTIFAAQRSSGQDHMALIFNNNGSSTPIASYNTGWRAMEYFLFQNYLLIKGWDVNYKVQIALLDLSNPSAPTHIASGEVDNFYHPAVVFPFLYLNVGTETKVYKQKGK